MMKNIFAFVLSVLILGCMPRHTEPIAGPLESTDPDVVAGREAFMMYCQKCHPNGEAGLGPGLNINPAPSFIKAFQVRHGLGVMPSFKKDEISPEKLDQILAYMKALKRN